MEVSAAEPCLRYGSMSGSLRQATSFKLPSRPPTSEAFGLHVRRAHHQARLWRAAIHSDPPALTAAECEWRADHATKTLLLVVLSAETMT